MEPKRATRHPMTSLTIIGTILIGASRELSTAETPRREDQRVLVRSAPSSSSALQSDVGIRGVTGSRRGTARGEGREREVSLLLSASLRLGGQFDFFACPRIP